MSWLWGQYDTFVLMFYFMVCLYIFLKGIPFNVVFFVVVHARCKCIFWMRDIFSSVKVFF